MIRRLLWAVALQGCARGCDPPPPPRPPSPPSPSVSRDVSVALPPSVPSPVCVREITHAAIGHPAGTGPIDTLSVACAGDRLAVFALRGHVLSRLVRTTVPGAGFSPPLVIGQGADRLGPVMPDGVDGPVAWRSPTTDLTPELERDTVWAAQVQTADGGTSVLRADLTMPAGVAGLGVLVAEKPTAEGLFVMSSHGSEDAAPGVFRHRLTLDRRTPETLTAMPSARWEGELDAWDFTRGTALTREHVNEGVSFVATRAGAAPQRFASPGPLAMVSPRGVAVGDRSAFLYADFRVGRPDSGLCLPLSDGVCIEPGAVSLLVASDHATRRIELSPRGMPDALSADGDGLVAMFVSPENGREARQRVVRVSLDSDRVTERTLRPPEGMPAIDHPALVQCGTSVWLVAEVSAPESAVTALPLACVLGD